MIGEGCPIPDATYAWTTGGGAPFASTLQTQVNPTTTTTYTLTVTMPPPGNKQYATSVTVEVIPAYAGPDQVICPTQSATIGQGCAPAGTTYEWRVANTLAVFANTLQTTVTPSTTTTYELTVQSPGSAPTRSQVTVTVFDPNVNFMPTYTRTAADDCNRIYTYRITNFNSAYNYSIDTSLGLNVLSGVSSSGVFRLQGYGRYARGNFRVTANFTTCGGNSATSPSTTITYGPCQIGTPSPEAATAYPNPASETLSLPANAEQAVLLNSQGRPVILTGKAGSLDVRSLPPGLYNLRTLQNGKMVNQRIEVKH